MLNSVIDCRDRFLKNDGTGRMLPNRAKIHVGLASLLKKKTRIKGPSAAVPDNKNLWCGMDLRLVGD